jgi:hypothetical protein
MSIIAEEKDYGKLYSFEELYKRGVRPGDVVAVLGPRRDNGPTWEYVLLRDGIPEEYNTALCSYRTPETPEKVYGNQIGFHWCGPITQRFRLITKEELGDFINSWIIRLKEPFNYLWNSGWYEIEYAQILGALAMNNLLTSSELVKLNKELKDIHNFDILKIFQDRYITLY